MTNAKGLLLMFVPEVESLSGLPYPDTEFGAGLGILDI